MREAVAGLAGGEPVGIAFAHPSSLRVLEFSVKVVRHNSEKSFCGRLWKMVSTAPTRPVRFSRWSLTLAVEPCIISPFSLKELC